MELITREESAALGQKTYFTGVACKHGHLSERWVCNGTCRACIVASSKTDRGREVRRIYEKSEGYLEKIRSPKVREQRRITNRIREKKPSRILYNRDLRFRRKYGLEKGEFELMLAVQGSACLICARPFENLGCNKTRKGAPVIDHCHTTGKVRALLCGTCNSGIGMFDESPDLLRKAAAYVAQMAELIAPDLSHK